MVTITKEYKPQSEDYFTLTGIGFTPTGSVTPEAPIIKNVLTTSTPYYTTVVNSSTPQYLGYTFMYVDGVPYSNPIPNGVANIGATAINGLSLRIDNITLTNTGTTTATVDLIKASPANVVKDSANIIPPVQVARYVIDSKETIYINKDDIDIVLKNYIAQTQSQPYYMTGDGLALAFPDSVKITTTATTTGTTTKTTTYTTTYTSIYGIYSVNVTAVAHYEP